MRKSGLLQWLSHIAAGITIIGAPISFFILIGQDQIVTAILAVAICLLLALSWVLLIWREFAYSRKARFAEATECIHQCFHNLRDAWFSMLSGDSENTFKEHLLSSVKSFSSAMTLISGVHCRVCIKDIVCPDPSIEPIERALKVETICRSEESSITDRQTQDDWISRNTDFNDLFMEPSKRFFICNDLNKLAGYQNSHWTQVTRVKKEYEYFSTIVWIVRKVFQGKVNFVESYHPDHDCIGFLCVDSMARGAFRRRFDVNLGMAYADALYIILKSWREKKRLVE